MRSTKLLVRLFGVLIGGVVAMCLVFVGTAAADESPPGCTDNALDLTLSRNVGTTKAGGTITYTVSVKNDATPTHPNPCDVTNADITLTLPNPVNGTATGTTLTLASAASFPADGSGDATFTGLTFTVPSDGSFTASTATAKAQVQNSILHDNTLVNDSADVTKTISTSVVDAFISIRPNATNAVGVPHTFTVTLWKQVVTPATTLAAAAASGDTNVKVTSVTGFAAGQTLRVGTELVLISSVGTAGAGGTGITFAPALGTAHASGANVLGYVPAAGEHVDFALASGNGAAGSVNSGATTCGVAGADTDANGQCVIVFSSATPGTVVGHATSTLTIGGVPVTRSTGDSYVLDGPDATKTYVDAFVTLSPPTATNAVGQPHTFTATVYKNLGGGPVTALTAPASPGATSVSVASSAGFSVGDAAVIGTGAGAEAATVTSVGAGTLGVSALAKPHSSSDSVIDYVPAAGETVSTSIADSLGATSNMTGGSCGAGSGTSGSGTTNGAGQCTIIINGPSSGKVTAHASISTTFGGLISSPLVRATGDSYVLDSPDAVKTYVDANIKITPQTATNERGTSHTFTVTVLKDLGDGNGLTTPAAGETVSTKIINSLGASSTMTGGSCGNISGTAGGGTTDAAGQCTIIINGPTTGVVKAFAYVTVHFAGGVTIDRDADSTTPTSHGPGGTDEATKTWVDANIAITPQTKLNPTGTSHTFTVTVLKDTGNGAGLTTPAAGETVSTKIVDSLGATSTMTGGSCGAASGTTGTGTTDANGQCTIVIDGPTTGLVQAFAYVTVHFPDGITVSRDADSTTATIHGPGGTDEASKTWVDANIAITPQTKSNERGTSHTFTVTVLKDLGDGHGLTTPAAGENVTTKIVNSNGATSTMTGGTCGNISGLTGSGTTDANGQCTIVINGPTTGTVQAFAYVTVHFAGGITIDRDTDSTTATGHGPGGTDQATKTWVDANIGITPQTKSNPTGTSHTFTVTVLKDIGDGNGLTTPAAGETVTTKIVDSLGATSTMTGGSCGAAGGTTGTGTTDANGQCTIIINGPTTGLVQAFAYVTVHFAGGLTINRDADSTTPTIHGPGGTEEASKTWVDANISITPQTKANPVGTSHTFTVTVLKDIGDGNGLTTPAAGETVTTKIVNSNGATSTMTGGSCGAAGGTTGTGTTDANGQCTIVINGPTSGTVQAFAYVTVHFTGGATVSRDADSTTPTGHGPGGTDEATKNWVDANISITPQLKSNEVGQSHTFTVTVLKDLGGGAGLTTPAAGETVSTKIVNSNGATSTMTGGSCGAAGGTTGTGTTDANGQCTIVINGPTTGTVQAFAYVTVHFAGGITIDRDADSTTATGHGPGGTDEATKKYVDANISITPQTKANPVGTSHTFTVTVLKDIGDGNGLTTPAAGETVTTKIVNSNGATSTMTGGSCGAAGGTTGTGTTDANGQCTIIINGPTSGTVKAFAYVTVHFAGGATVSRDADSTTATSHGTGGTDEATKTWVDANISITPQTKANERTTSHTFTVTVLKDLGGGAGMTTPAAGETVTTKIVNSNGATSTMTGGSCGAAGGTTGTGTTDANGQCTIVINGPTTGTVKAFAYVTVHFAGGITIDRDADSTTATGHGPGGTDEATKTWVDANISITPAFGTNATGVDHTLTAHVQIDTGNGSGFGNPPNGTVTVTFTLANSAGATATFDGPSSCSIVNGICTVNIKSPTPGITTVNATTTVTVGGVPLSRGTGAGQIQGPGGSGPASKLWIATQVLNSSNNPTTTFAAPATVHDQFTAAPGVIGTVTFTLYDTNNCSGSPDASNAPQTVALTLLSSGVVVSSPITLSPAATQAYSFLVHYTADPSSPYPSQNAGCEPFSVTQTATGNFTPGYWKNHGTATSKLLPLTLGNYTVDTFAKAQDILSGMGCGSVGVENCMAGMLLATELNLAQGGAKLPCALSAVSAANALLVKYHYNGAGSTPSPALSSADAATMMTLHDQLSNYSQDGVPTSC
jgi:hypothetical protein